MADEAKPTTLSDADRDIRFTRLLLGTPAAAFAAWT
jgi:hypothetical protein